MKRALILCLFLAISGNTGKCSGTFFPPLQPMNTTSNAASTEPLQDYTKSKVTTLADPFAQSPNTPISYPKIDQIESSIFGHTYPKQDITTRLSRIEKSIFSTTYPDSPLSQRVDNIVANYNQINQYKNISKNVLSNMESKILHQSYPGNDAQTRIERLEQQVFGAVQSGDLITRYSTLRMATNKYNMNQYGQNYNQNPLSSTQGGLRGVMGNLGSMLRYGGGQMTGFTPSIDPFPNNFSAFGTDNGYGGNSGFTNYGSNNNGYYSGYNSPNRYGTFANLGGTSRSGSAGYGSSSAYGMNQRYTDTYQNSGMGSRVTILD